MFNGFFILATSHYKENYNKVDTIFHSQKYSKEGKCHPIFQVMVLL
jgi:hypothetical protein